MPRGIGFFSIGIDAIGYDIQPFYRLMIIPDGQTAISASASLGVSNLADILTSENSAAAAAVAADSAAAVAVAELSYLVANPGAVLLEKLPKALPASSGVWWLNGQIISRS